MSSPLTDHRFLTSRNGIGNGSCCASVDTRTAGRLLSLLHGIFHILLSASGTVDTGHHLWRGAAPVMAGRMQYSAVHAAGDVAINQLFFTLVWSRFAPSFGSLNPLIALSSFVHCTCSMRRFHGHLAVALFCHIPYILKKKKPIGNTLL